MTASERAKCAARPTRKLDVFVLHITCVGFVAAFAVVACAREAPEAQIAPNRALWEAAGIANYEFNIVHYGAAPAPPMRVNVREGAVHSASLLCLPPRTEDMCRAWEESRKDEYAPDRLVSRAKSFPQLIDIVSWLTQQDRHARTLLQFDTTYGFPVRFNFDDPDGDDEEFGFEVSEFRVIQ